MPVLINRHLFIEIVRPSASRPVAGGFLLSALQTDVQIASVTKQHVPILGYERVRFTMWSDKTLLRSLNIKSCLLSIDISGQIY